MNFFVMIAESASRDNKALHEMQFASSCVLTRYVSMHARQHSNEHDAHRIVREGVSFASAQMGHVSRRGIFAIAFLWLLNRTQPLFLERTDGIYRVLNHVSTTRRKTAFRARAKTY
jgi:hypothetical protein